jgi:hypothetical protein
MNTLQATGVCLLGVILSLLVIGIISATPIRHIIQVSPLVLAFIPVMLRKSWSKYTALPLFIFWLVIMIFIWLYLLGIANIVNGNFSPVEIGMSILIGISCGWGIVASLRAQSSVRLSTRIVAFMGLFALQVCAMWVSLLPPFAGS